MGTTKHLVFNVTDGFFASPDEMTREEAYQFIKKFPERFKFQGYYKDSNGQRIPPEDVVLKIIQSNKVGEELKYLLDETESRRREILTMRKHNLDKSKSKGRSH
jgi:hypothetical protein